MGKIDVCDSGVLSVDDLGKLFQGRSTSLDVHEVDEDNLAENPDGVDKVKSPGVASVAGIRVFALPGLESKRVEVGVEEKSDLDRDVHEHETLGTEGVGKDLDGVADEKTRPASRVENTVHPNKEDHAVVGARSLVLFRQATGKGPKDKRDEHSAGRKEEGETTVESLNKQSTADGDDHVENSLAGAHDETVGLVRHASVGVKSGRVVGDDTVARPLREDTEGEENGETIAVALGFEEVDVSAAVFGNLLHLDGIANLTEFKLDGGMVGVTAGVILGEDGQSLIMAIFGDEETGRFRDP